MEKIGEDQQYEYFIDQVEGHSIRVYKEKSTGEITYNGDDMVKTIGFNSVAEFLSSDVGLDAINQWKELYPDSPVFGRDGMMIISEE